MMSKLLRSSRLTAAVLTAFQAVAVLALSGCIVPLRLLHPSEPEQKLLDQVATYPFVTESSDIYEADVTGDGNADFCISFFFGSGMARRIILIYDDSKEEFYSLDGLMGFNYDIAGVEDGRLVVSRLGPEDKSTTGTVKVEDGKAMFVVRLEGVSSADWRARP